MAYLIAILITSALLVAFLVLSAVERARGFRLFGVTRSTLDRHVARASYVATHVDWGAFSVHVAQTGAERVAHDAVHASLLVVRATERTLTRTIKPLRERVATTNPAEMPVEGSQLIATIVRFRKNFSRPSTTATKNDRVES